MQTDTLPSTLPEASLLLPQVHRKLRGSLELVDRVFDYLQASLLLCLWYGYHSRLQEAQYLSSSCFSLAVDMRLHQINDAVVREGLSSSAPSSFWDGTILGPPRDCYDLYLRITVFWHAYVNERLMGLITGLPTACDGVAATTIWPRSLEELESEGISQPKYLHSIKELLAGEVELWPINERFIAVNEWKAMTLLGKAVELSGALESLGESDQFGLENTIHDINALANAVLAFDSTLPQVDRCLPPYQSLKSNPDGKSWCAALQTRVGMCATYVYLLRSIEAAFKLLTSSSNQEENPLNGIDAQIRAALVTLIPKDGHSFVNARFSFARTGIRLAHEVARQHIEDDPHGFQSTRWLTHLPSLTGYMLPTMVLAVVSSIHDLEAQMLVHPTDSAAYRVTTMRLGDAEGTFTQGMELLNLLKNRISVLGLQIARIKQARHPPTPQNETPQSILSRH